MRQRRVWLALLAAFTGAAGQPVAVNLPADEPPFGLACNECSLAADAACSALWMSPVVAEARGARIRSATRQCYGPTCDIVESVTFSQLHYFRLPPQPIPDRFRVLHSTGDVHADEAGIVLAAELRYVVFASPSDGALTVMAACPIAEARELK